MSEYYLEDDNKNVIPYLNKYSEHFLNKNILLSGGCASGKTTIINEIVKKLSDKVPNIIKFVMPNKNNISDEKFDSDWQLIEFFENKTKTISIEILQKIIDRQNKCATINEYVNNLEILESLFNKVADEKELNIIKQIDIDISYKINCIKANDPGLYHAEKKEIRDLQNKLLKSVYQKCINENKETLLKDQSLDEKQKLTINYENFCPNMMLIFDGCEEFIREHQKDPVISEIFYSGKNYNLTRIFTFFNAKHIHPHLRRNFDVLIFTTSYEAINHFNIVSNGYDKKTRKLAELAINRIFSPEQNLVTYRKLVFFPYNLTDRFQCILVDNL